MEKENFPDFSAYLSEGKKALLEDASPRKKVEIYRKPPSDNRYTFKGAGPDAIVLAVTKTHCRKCKSTFSHPGKNLLVRFGRIFTAYLGPASLLSSLPHEHIIGHNETPFCLQCFGGASLPVLEDSPKTHIDNRIYPEEELSPPLQEEEGKEK